MADTQGPELRALADTLDHAGWSGLEYTEGERLLIISALERAAAAELPDPNGGCVCVAYPQDAGGGYTEWSTEYEPACPVHSEHVYDPQKGEWVLRAVAAEGEKAEALTCDFCRSTDDVAATGRQGMRGCAKCRGRL